MEPASSSEVLICQTCGNEGFTNAFVYCCKCLGVVVHRYCLDVMPRTMDELVPWFCEDCKLAVPNQFALPTAAKSSRSRKKEDVGPLKAPHSKKKQKKQRAVASLIAGTEEVNVEEVMMKTNLNRTEIATCVVGMEDGACQKLALDDASQFADSSNDIHHNHGVLARPVIDPIWRGTFEIPDTNYGLLEGFVGHLSNKACEKVFEEANMLSPLLCLEMHPKAVLWPKSFQEVEPSSENIALYFFPGDTKNERNFDDLVIDMMDEGLAMRAATKNAELLIFTSRDLPSPYWRFQGKFYLWGVFRAKRNEPVPAVAMNGKKSVRKLETLDTRSPRSPLTDTDIHSTSLDDEKWTYFIDLPRVKIKLTRSYTDNDDLSLPTCLHEYLPPDEVDAHLVHHGNTYYAKCKVIGRTKRNIRDGWIQFFRNSGIRKKEKLDLLLTAKTNRKVRFVVVNGDEEYRKYIDNVNPIPVLNDN